MCNRVRDFYSNILSINSSYTSEELNQAIVKSIAKISINCLNSIVNSSQFVFNFPDNNFRQNYVTPDTNIILENFWTRSSVIFKVCFLLKRARFFVSNLITV